MGQQTNKVQKRRRRAAYLDRQKAKVKAKTANRPAPKKKPAAKKEKAAAGESAAE